MLLAGGGQGKPVGQRVAKEATAAEAEPVEAEVRFTDDSVLKLTLRDQAIRVATRYGKLRVAVSDVRFIDFATRIPDADARRAEASVADLGSPQYRLRRAAEAALLKLREKAYPALLQAAKNKDAEVAQRAERLVKQLRESVPPDQLAFRKNDVVQTVDSQISGRIEGESLKAHTFQFGEVPLHLGHMHSLQYTSADPDPSHVDALRGLIGKTFRFKVTGAVEGPLYGAGVYTSDSSLAAAAVQVGILKAGEAGVVRVTFVAFPGGFGSSNAHGVTSSPYSGPFRGAFTVSR
jgi:hypothetical protein